jgi:indoleamine 2,3-dioxygenase
MEHVMEQFDITENGFLPNSPPIHCLPIKFAEYDAIANNLSEHIKSGTLRTAVLNIKPVGDLSTLDNDKPALNRLYSILSMITHGYIWSHSKEELATFDTIPFQLAIPWHYTAQKLGIAPVLTHASVDLYNWKMIDPNGIPELDNMHCIHTMTGLLDEEWFYLIMTDIEKKGVVILKSIISMILNKDVDNVICNMNVIKNVLNDMTRVLLRMKEKCNPEVFYNVLRPFLGGWKEKGLIYEGVSEEKLYFTGGSAAQSSLFPCVDIVLGINHSDVFFKNIKEYMPVKHVEFIEYVGANFNINDYIDSLEDSEKITALCSAVDNCKKNLVKFRMGHRGIAHSYITKVAEKANPSKDYVELGTGGTELGKFLNKVIEETQV